ncbi:Subtilisin protease SBT3.5 [Spatholobus suberectus]|nr:Subtilisin protease SBT3.5 [Spatholobus suberectus]
MGTPVILKFSKLAILVFFALVCIAMSDSAAKPLDQHASGSSPAVHIVYTERPQDEEPEAYHIRTLSSVLGSEEAAKEALLYSYKSAASGFSAKLTPEQVEQISSKFGWFLIYFLLVISPPFKLSGVIRFIYVILFFTLLVNDFYLFEIS